MKKKLDAKDLKILYQLDANSRQSNAEIAKKVGVSKQVVGLRIKRLLKEKYISSFYSIIDISKLGFTIHKNFLRLQNASREKEKKLITFLKNHPNVVWIASCDGKFDLAFGTWARDVRYLEKTLQELQQKFGNIISERQIATIIQGEFFVRDYIINKESSSGYHKYFFGSVPKPTSIDKLDWEILAKLANNPRANSVKLAQEISLSSDAIRDRIKKLELSGIIKNYNIVPNESVYPFLHYKVLIGFRNSTEEKENSLTEFCRMHPNMVYIVKALGPWEFEIDMEVESVEQYRNIMMELKTKFNDLIKDYSVLHIYQVHKYNFCPSVQYEE